jgi:prepilin-type N-terminal cleavage/methylation domain-containing protein
MNRKLISSEAGFTLIELMIVGVILSVLMLAFTGYMYQQAKQTKNQETKQTYNQLKSGVLDASSQAESLSQSESLQFDSTLPTATPVPPSP